MLVDLAAVGHRHAPAGKRSHARAGVQVRCVQWRAFQFAHRFPAIQRGGSPPRSTPSGRFPDTKKAADSRAAHAVPAPIRRFSVLVPERLGAWRRSPSVGPAGPLSRANPNQPSFCLSVSKRWLRLRRFALHARQRRCRAKSLRQIRSIGAVILAYIYLRYLPYRHPIGRYWNSGIGATDGRVMQRGAPSLPCPDRTSPGDSSNNLGDVPNTSARSSAAAAVIPRLPLISSFSRVVVHLSLAAKAACVIPPGLKKLFAKNLAGMEWTPWLSCHGSAPSVVIDVSAMTGQPPADPPATPALHS